MEPFYQTSTQGTIASFAFIGQAVELHGDLDYGHGQYTVVSLPQRLASKFSFC